MKFNKLRKKAEEKLKLAPQFEDVDHLSSGEIRHLLLELRTRQVELEIQNEELRQTQEELVAARNRYADLYEFAPVGYFNLNATDEIVDANMTAADMLGINRAELLDKQLSEFILKEDQDIYYHLRRKLHKSRCRQSGELRMCNKGDNPIWVNLHCNAIMDEVDYIYRYRVSISDITEKKMAELKLTAYRDQLEKKVAERTEELELRSKELEAFSYTIAHDLRSPLRTITSFSQILLTDAGLKLDQEEQDSLQRVIASAKYMAELIDDILKLSKVNRSDFVTNNINLSQLAWDIINDLQENDKERSVAIKVAPGLRCKGDKRLIHIAMENLLGNAWKYTSKEAQATIEVGSIEENGKKIIYVRDNGAGFDMKYADKLYTPFQRLHRQEEYEGTGVGLATLQRVIHRHGGEVWAESEVGKGATFYFTLK
jgi:PAS domain S-box-containing protein